MVALPRRQRLNLPLAPLVAGALAASVALTAALLPAATLGNLVLDSGIAALIPAAEPPLGITARAALILVGGGGVGLVAWFATFLLVGTRSIAVSRTGEDRDRAPKVRHADAHPDAPPRRPLSANRDLGIPFLDVRVPSYVEAEASREIEDDHDEVPSAAPPVERSLPAAPNVNGPVNRRVNLPADLPTDLDTPMSAFDPKAIRADPLDWFPPPARLIPRPPLLPVEPFELTPAIRETLPPPRAAPEPASIHALLDRLERSVGQRTPEPVREDSLRDSLESLRRLATNR